jgi:GNAT superfamily N-acetyltransferase
LTQSRGPIERFDLTRHRTTEFACGNDSLDRWLKRYAGQSDRRDAARTFVATDEQNEVIGYYALVVGELVHEEATEAVRRGMSRHFPIPVPIIARLAVDQRHQDAGLGSALLGDALARIALAAEQVAVRAVVVHAIDEPAAAFYRRFGFRGLTPRTLMVTLAELRAAGYS